MQGIQGIRGIGYRRRRGGVTPGPSWPSAPVAGLHVYSEAGPAWCRQFADGTGSVTANDPVGYLHNAGTLETPFTQATTGARPLMTWDAEKDAWYLQFDGVDDSLRLLLDTYTVCEIWVAITAQIPSSAFGVIAGCTDVVDGTDDVAISYVQRADGSLRSFEGGAVLTRPSGTGIRSTRKINASIQSWQINDTEATTATNSPVIKDRLTLARGWYPSTYQYGKSHIYAIAATIGSVMSTEQVNALKADWSAKFGVEFAW